MRWCLMWLGQYTGQARDIHLGVQLCKLTDPYLSIQAYSYSSSLSDF